MSCSLHVQQVLSKVCVYILFPYSSAFLGLRYVLFNTSYIATNYFMPNAFVDNHNNYLDVCMKNTNTQERNINIIIISVSYVQHVR